MPGFSNCDLLFDIIICGAGPGGASTAWNLKESGYAVALLDKADFPRDKICGDALSGKVVSVLRYMDPTLVSELYEELIEKIGSYGIRFYSPSRICLDIPFRQDIQSLDHAPGFVSRRIDFDGWLHQKAVACKNVSWFPHHGVEQVTFHHQGVEVKAGGKIFQGKMVIGADGAQSQVAREAGLRNISKKHHSAGVRAYVRGVEGFHEYNFIELHYLKDLLPGYFWIFPLPGGAANVGLGMLSSDIAKQPGLNLRQRLTEIIHEHPEIRTRFQQATIEGPIQGFGLPLGSRRLPISSDRCILVGDAASLIDPFTGEGIGNAMVSGRLAAQLLMERDLSVEADRQSLAEYDRRVYAKLGKELSISHMMQKLVRFPRLFDFVARKASKNSSLQSLMTMMFENLDLRKELTRPGFYWNLFLGSQRNRQPAAPRETTAP